MWVCRRVSGGCGLTRRAHSKAQARLASAGVVETEPGQTSPTVSIEASVEAAEGPQDGLGMPKARGQSANADDSWLLLTRRRRADSQVDWRRPGSQRTIIRAGP